MHAPPAFAVRLQVRIVNLARASALAATLICSLAVSAQQPPDPSRPSTTWGLGVGLGSKQKPYTGIDRDNEVLPLIEFENEYVHLLGPALDVKLPSLAISETQSLDFRIVARYAIFGGYEADDAPILAGMGERKDGFWAGARVKWKTSLVNVDAAWMHDVSGYSKGQRFGLGFDRNWRFGRHFMLSPRVVALWQDRKYNDYYFGVSPSEARPGRPAYQADSGFNAEAGLRSIYLIDRHNSLFLDVSVTSLSSEVKDSPLVDRSTENRVLFAYVYRF